MIIEFPTALYLSELPLRASDVGSVTFEISSEDPPRQSQNLQQLPIAEQLRPLPDKIFSREDDRANAGDLLFSISQSARSETGSNKKQFEIGQFLDFNQESLPEVTVTEVPTKLDLQQNTNILDLESLGLSEDDIEVITKQANETFNQTINELNSLKEQIDNTKILISENQKSINEARKASSAVELLEDVNSILATIQKKEQDLLQERDSLTNTVNVLNKQAKDKLEELLSIRELVR